MLTVGLILLLAAVAVAADALAQNTFHVRVDLFGAHFSMPFWQVAVAGIVLGAIALLGLLMTLRGMKKAVALRKDRRRMSRELAERPVVTLPADGAPTDDAPYPGEAAPVGRRIHRPGSHRASANS
jgi:uncharacterized integral membrane protein